MYGSIQDDLKQTLDEIVESGLYKSERNMYLAGFALTLLLVIGRITQLMQESVQLEAETERVQKLKQDEAKAYAKRAAKEKTDD